MKKLLIAVAVSLAAGGALYAQKHEVKKPEPVKKVQKTTEKNPGRVTAKELEPNTRGWLHGIRVKVYGFDPNSKDGKSGC